MKIIDEKFVTDMLPDRVDTNIDLDTAKAFNQGWNACRAVVLDMLQHYLECADTYIEPDKQQVTIDLLRKPIVNIKVPPLNNYLTGGTTYFCDIANWEYVKNPRTFTESFVLQLEIKERERETVQ